MENDLLEMSPQINELADALSKVQSVLKNAPKDATNPFFKSKYSDITSIWETARQPLTSNGLAVSQTTRGDDSDSVNVVTTLLHKSGQWIRGSLKMKPSKPDPQGMGSAMTYARRYALAAIIGIAPEDDDGNEAVHLPPKNKVPIYKETPISPPTISAPPSASPPKAEHQKDNTNPFDVPFPGPKNVEYISAPQRNRLYAICKASHIPDNEMKNYLFKEFRIDSSSHIQKKDYQIICDWAEKYKNRPVTTAEIASAFGEKIIPGIND